VTSERDLSVFANLITGDMGRQMKGWLAIVVIWPMLLLHFSLNEQCTYKFAGCPVLSRQQHVINMFQVFLLYDKD
jgi:hypothetical protein